MLFNYQMNPTLFYQLLQQAQGNIEDVRPWVILRTKRNLGTVSPATSLTANSLYLTPFALPDNFSCFYAPKRSIQLLGADGITFRWYEEIPQDRALEYKDDCTKFYVDNSNNLYLCGIVDQTYSILCFYIGYSTSVTATTSWAFPATYHPMLADEVAKIYKQQYDYDIVTEEAAKRIQANQDRLLSKMENWDDKRQKSQVEGADYPMPGQSSNFLSRVVGDNDQYSN